MLKQSIQTLVGILLAVALIALIANQAECQDGCSIQRCNEDIICAGNCSCSMAPGQPWGTCRPW